jgi:uncharacterized glyoxalase superfamily protein PhnB
MVDQIILTLHVPSVEETAAWYERVLGWQAHFDTFNTAGQCVFGSVLLKEGSGVGLNLARSDEREAMGQCDHCASWIYVADVDAVYRRVVEQGWPVESAPADQFWGERLFRLRDLNGHQLAVVQRIEELGLEEIRERQRKLLQ